MWPNPDHPKEEDVRSLRSAAEAGDWFGCSGAAVKLLLRLTEQRALELSRQQVAARLPVFERQSPGVLWPRELLQGMDGASVQGRCEWPEGNVFACTGPGAYYFIVALEELWKASRGSRDTDDDIKFVAILACSIRNAIFSEMMEAWGSRYPGKWSRWYQLAWEEDNREQQELKREMLSGPESSRIGCRAWLEVAEVLERAATRPSGSPGADVLALRQAADEQDWVGCADLTRRLLSQLPMQRAVELVRQQLADRLPGFERHHPGVTWPRQFIEAVSHASGRNGLVWPGEQDFDGPGARTFINALREFWGASQGTGGDAQRVDDLVVAIDWAIAAEKQEHWGSRRLAQWRNYHHQPLKAWKGEHYNMMAEMGIGLEARRIERAAWLRWASVLDGVFSM